MTKSTDEQLPFARYKTQWIQVTDVPEAATRKKKDKTGKQVFLEGAFSQVVLTLVLWAMVPLWVAAIAAFGVILLLTTVEL